VGAGAVLVAYARWALSLSYGLLSTACAWPNAEIWPLILINFVGAGLMGYLQPRLFWGKGVLGGFTSFSSFATAAVAMTVWGALGYIVFTVLGCIGSSMLAVGFRE